MRQRLAQLADTFPDLIESVRGDGLMQGFKCKALNTDIVAAFRAEKFLTVPAGDNVVRLIPPLTIDDADIQEAVAKMETALKKLQKAG